MASTALDRLESWLDAEEAPRDRGKVVLFRQIFAGVWLLYDAIDAIGGMTERQRIWFPHPRDPHLLWLQVLLVVCGAMLVVGRSVWLFGVAAAALRGVEAFRFFALNDFFFGTVIYLLLAHSDGGPFAGGRRPRWVRDTLIAQFAWIYLATGLLKLNPDWLGGGHIFVRTQYLWTSHGWPYPAPLENLLAGMTADAWLARLGATFELTLGVVMAIRRPYWLAAGLVLAVHSFGAMLTNVWFFSASMIAGVLVLLPRAERS
jgi:hypothetical protein